MHEVMNHAHAVSGRRMRLMPLTRRSSVVVMKFNEPNNWPTQNSAIEVIQRTTPRTLAGACDRTHGIERGVLRPATQGRSVAHEEGRHQNHEAGECDPERHHVEVREGHVFGAYLDGQEEITEGREGSGREHKEDHDGAMHGHQLQVVLRRHHPARGAGFRKQLQAGDRGVVPRQVDAHEPGKKHSDKGGEQAPSA